MKRFFFLTALILFAVSVSSQSLQKGCFLGVQDLTITLHPDVSLDQYLDFTINTFIPEAEKAFPGMKVFIMRGGIELGSGEDAEEKYAVIYYFESAKVQRKYFDDEGNFTDAGAGAIEKLEPTFEKYDQLGTNSASLTGWMIL